MLVVDFPLSMSVGLYDKYACEYNHYKNITYLLLKIMDLCQLRIEYILIVKNLLGNMLHV